MTRANPAYRGGAALLLGALAALFCGLWLRERRRVRRVERELTEVYGFFETPEMRGLSAVLELQAHVGGHIALVDFDGATPAVPKRTVN